MGVGGVTPRLTAGPRTVRHDPSKAPSPVSHLRSGRTFHPHLFPPAGRRNTRDSRRNSHHRAPALPASELIDRTLRAHPGRPELPIPSAQ